VDVVDEGIDVVSPLVIGGASLVDDVDELELDTVDDVEPVVTVVSFGSVVVEPSDGDVEPAAVVAVAAAGGDVTGGPDAAGRLVKSVGSAAVVSGSPEVVAVSGSTSLVPGKTLIPPMPPLSAAIVRSSPSARCSR
jgi:hypothetical protein